MRTVAEKVAVHSILQSHFGRNKWEKMTDWRECFFNTEYTIGVFKSLNLRERIFEIYF